MPDELATFEELKKYNESEAMAAYRMAQIYNFSFVDIPKALNWYRKAESLGDLSHTKYFKVNFISLQYIWEKIKNDTATQELFKKASQIGNNLDILRVMRFHGHFRDNSEEALKWLKIAVKFGDKTAMKSLASKYMFRDKPEITKAFKYYKKAYRDVGKVYYAITLDFEDKLSEIKYLKKATKFNNEEALYYLGQIYFPNFDEEDEEIEIKSKLKNIPKAVECFKRAAELGNIYSNYRLAEIYIAEYQDDNEALKWCKRYAEGDEAEANFYVGRIYLDSEEIENYQHKAIEYFNKAADLGSYSAKEWLAVCYYCGCLVEENEDKAVELMKEANYFDGEEAYECLRKIYDKYEFHEKDLKYFMHDYSWITYGYLDVKLF